MRLHVLAIAACLPLCLGAGEAAGGAWTLARGSGQLIMTAGREIAPIGAFMGGTAESDSNSSQIYIEYGLADDWTIGAIVYGEFSSTDTDELEFRLGGHVRHRVWQSENGDVVSIQIGASAPIENWLGEIAPQSLPYSVPEAHLRLLYGRGWQNGWGNSFVSTEAGVQWRGEEANEELRLDVTTGHEAWKGVLGLFSIYSALPLGDRNDPTLKLAPSIAYTIWPWLGPNDRKPYGTLYPSTIQLGIVWDALNPDDGLGVGVSIWKSF
jgi:hypothetical protein